ncbi:MAG: hypothetical protein ACPIOQ_71640, partial [Promethearchaeia archaeon]
LLQVLQAPIFVSAACVSPPTPPPGAPVPVPVCLPGALTRKRTAGKGSEVPRGILGLHVIGAVVAVASSVLVQCRFDRAFQARVRLLLGKDKSQ